tara:strand:+ start:497 stop:919 length:423 start_codon:yes stop_codon:yes gene_type:complete
MTNFSLLADKIEAASTVGKMDIVTDYIRDAWAQQLFSSVKESMEAAYEAITTEFEAGDKSPKPQDFLAHIWHACSREFTNGGSDYGPKTRADLAEYLLDNLNADTLAVVVNLKGYQDARKYKASGKVGMGLTRIKKVPAK